MALEHYTQIDLYKFLYECDNRKIYITIDPHMECGKELWLFLIDSYNFAICISENGDPKQLVYRDDLPRTKEYLYIIHTLCFFYEQHTWKRILHSNIPRVTLNNSKYCNYCKSYLCETY
jgi:hypothetical protein